MNDTILNHIFSRIQESPLQSEPFSHVHIEQFLPNDFANEAYADLLQVENSEPDNHFISANGIKREYKQPRDNHPAYNQLMSLFSTSILLPSIESKFGLLDGSLHADPSYDGGGYVISPANTHLRYHADFNFSSKIDKYRVLNIILYMNKGYLPSYGGQLHLLDHNTMTVEKAINPVFNSAVIFITNKSTPHGVSINRNGFERRSINAYFYSNNPIKEDQRIPHKTIWIYEKDKRE